MAINIVLARNDIRQGHVITLHEPPDGLAFDIAVVASLNKEIVSARVTYENGVTYVYVKGKLTHAEAVLPNVKHVIPY